MGAVNTLTNCIRWEKEIISALLGLPPPPRFGRRAIKSFPFGWKIRLLPGKTRLRSRLRRTKEARKVAAVKSYFMSGADNLLSIPLPRVLSPGKKEREKERDGNIR